MGFILVHVHAKLGDGLSNQMHKARALGPDYSVRWWRSRNMHPPKLDPVDYLQKRIEWRYLHGIVESNPCAEIILGAAEEELPRVQYEKFDLLFTSPPYFSVTKYRHDSWIRLWLLNEGPVLPDWKEYPKMTRQDEYKNMLDSAFTAAAKLLKPSGVVWVRTDARKTTKIATMEALRGRWPKEKLYEHADPLNYRTQTAQFGDNSPKPGEVDFFDAWLQKATR